MRSWYDIEPDFSSSHLVCVRMRLLIDTGIFAFSTAFKDGKESVWEVGEICGYTQCRGLGLAGVEIWLVI